MSQAAEENKPKVTDGARLMMSSLLRGDAWPVAGEPRVSHWLLGLAERHGEMVRDLVGPVSVEDLSRQVRSQMKRGEFGEVLNEDVLVERAFERARSRGKDQAAERDVASVILIAAGYQVVDPGGAWVPGTPAGQASPKEQAGFRQPETAGGQEPGPTGSREATAAGPRAPQAALAYHPRAAHPTPTLNALGWDLTQAAAEGKLTPVVGREEETNQVVETLCRRTKRNPVLIGPAGVGKTAIVEGLAQRIVRGDVPAVLRGTRLISIPVSSLVAGTGIVGQLEERMKAVIHEASQDGIVLFIDEVHAVIGAGSGGHTPGGDVANQLKPALARGDVACIAATTDEEYRLYIERDSALERRFNPIRVHELTAQQTLGLLKSLRDDLSQSRGVNVPDNVLAWLVDFSDRYLRNRYFPDKAVDSLEQCVAHGVARGSNVIELKDAEAVARRMVGMPVSVEERLKEFSNSLRDKGLLIEEDIAALVARLDVTLRGFDAHQDRPNAVVLLTAHAAGRARDLSETAAETLYGGPDRVVEIDFSRFVHPADVTMLVGAPPGYVGHDESLPLHRLAQMPWSVLLCHNVDQTHPSALELLTQGLDKGFITDSRGKKIFLSDTMVVATVAKEPAALPRAMGFSAGEAPASAEAVEAAVRVTRQQLERELGTEFMAQIDVICSEVPSGQDRRRWLEQNLLRNLSERCRKRGVTIRFEESFLAWFLEQGKSAASSRDWERLVDAHVSPVLIPHLEALGQGPRTATLSYGNGKVEIDVKPGAEGGSR